MQRPLQRFLLVMFFVTIVIPQVFSSTVAERAKAFAPKTAAPVVLDGKRDANAVLGASVKTAEAKTLNLFTQHYTAAAHDAIYAKRQQVNLYRIKQFQATHTTPAFFDPTHTTGVKAKPEHFNPVLDAKNIAMAAAYAPYNNCSRVSTADVAAFAAAYPHEVAGMNLKALEGDIILPNAAGQAFAYNPFSYGMVLVYRLRNTDKLGGQAADAIDLYNKEQAFAWEAAAGIAKESVGTATTRTKPKINTHTSPQPAVTQADLAQTRASLKSHRLPIATSGTPMAAGG